MGHYDCKSCGATPYEEHSADCERFPSRPTDASSLTEALDMAARAAGWGDYNIALYNDGDAESIRAHAATLMENAAIKAENERLREALEEIAGAHLERGGNCGKLTPLGLAVRAELMKEEG